MNISLHEPLKPFSHLPGTEFLLPGSVFSIRIFPCKGLIYDQRHNPPHLISEITFDFQGPINQFTIINDLDRERISVSGETKQGWIRYHLRSDISSQGIECVFDRVPEGKYIEIDGKKIEIFKKTPFFFPYHHEPFFPSLEKLFLGNHKAQDVELIRRRKDLTEIFPLLFRIGQLIPYSGCKYAGAFFEYPNKEFWLGLFLKNFSSTFIPRLNDIDCQGIESSEMALRASTPLDLLRDVVFLMRHHFFKSEDHSLIILPHLLPDFHSGHFLNGSIPGLGKIHFEWTKKCIRRFEVIAEETVEWKFDFKSPIQSCRLRQKCGEKGIVYHNRTSVHIEKGSTYFFDNFQ